MIQIGPPDIRRLPNGTIDTAYYVLQAQRARTRAAAAFFRCVGQRLRGRSPSRRPGHSGCPARLGTKDAAV